MRSPALLFRILLCLLAGFGAACSHPKSDPLAEAQLFFERIRKGETQAAFDSASFAFQMQQNPKFFAERTLEYGLHEATVALTPLPGDAKTAKFQVDVTKKSGQKFPLILTLELQRGVWQVYSLRTPRNPKTGISENRFTIVGRSAAINTAAGMEVPDDATVRRLVDQSMQLFSDAIRKKSFADFYAHTADAWKRELTEQKLQNAFQAFIDKEADMSGIAKVEAVFDKPPQIGSDGLLAVSGHYPTKPYEVHFTVRYIYELPDWKLLGLNSYLKNPDEPAAKASPDQSAKPPP